MRLKKLLLIELTILTFIAIGLAILDLSLELNELQGAVFYLYLIYASAVFFSGNALTALFFLIKKQTRIAKNFLLTGLCTSAAGLLVAYLANRLFS